MDFERVKDMNGWLLSGVFVFPCSAYQMPSSIRDDFSWILIFLFYSDLVVSPPKTLESKNKGHLGA